MKAIYTLIFIWILYSPKVYSQHQYEPAITITFQSGDYLLEHAIFFSDEANRSATFNDGFSQVRQSFHATEYPSYVKFFLPGECHVTQETFINWKESLGQNEPELIANFIVKKGGKKYGITKYSITYNQNKYLVAQAHKEVNGQWYFPGLEENLELQSMIRFFTLVDESFFTTIETSPADFVKNQFLFDSHSKLQGEKLIVSFFDKYKKESQLYTFLNLFFEDAVQPIQSSRGQAFEELAIYFSNATQAGKELDYLLNLLQASLPVDALSHFTKISGIPFEKIIRDCPNALTP